MKNSPVAFWTFSSGDGCHCYIVAKRPLGKTAKPNKNGHSLQVTYGATAYNIFLVGSVPT
jgi:hypothetical protein